MCFHSKQTKKAQALKKRFNTNIDSKIEAKATLQVINGFDFPKTPIITNQSPNDIQLFNWGLIPNWASDDTIRTSTLNARIETLTEKPSFKHITSNRCLILSDGFFEWQWKDKKGKSKDKHLITFSNNELFAFAGLYDTWIDTKGNPYQSYTIITTEAKGIMREVHNSKLRMPLILNQEDEQDWLDNMNINDVKVPVDLLVSKNLNPQLGLF